MAMRAPFIFIGDRLTATRAEELTTFTAKTVLRLNRLAAGGARYAGCGCRIGNGTILDQRQATGGTNDRFGGYLGFTSRAEYVELSAALPTLSRGSRDRCATFRAELLEAIIALVLIFLDGSSAARTGKYVSHQRPPIQTLLLQLSLLTGTPARMQ